MLAQMGYALDRGGSGPDDPDALVLEFVQASGGIPAGVTLVPATRVEGMSFEFLNPRNPG